MIRTIELDTVINEGETVESMIADATRGTFVQGELVTMNGPAGGNPVIRYTGTKDELLVVAEQAYGEEGLDWVRGLLDPEMDATLRGE